MYVWTTNKVAVQPLTVTYVLLVRLLLLLLH